MTYVTFVSVYIGGPPHTPTRRAPPPPTGQRRRPSRPAPLPPSPNTQPSHNSVGVAPDETPPPSYTESDSVVTEMMELNISTQQDSPENQLYVLDQPHPLPDQLPEPYVLILCIVTVNPSSQYNTAHKTLTLHSNRTLV